AQLPVVVDRAHILAERGAVEIVEILAEEAREAVVARAHIAQMLFEAKTRLFGDRQSPGGRCRRLAQQRRTILDDRRVIDEAKILRLAQRIEISGLRLRPARRHAERKPTFLTA